MAEVTVWVEEDGFRHSYSVEHEDKNLAMDKACSFLETEMSYGKSGFTVELTKHADVQRLVEQLRKAARNSGGIVKLLDS